MGCCCVPNCQGNYKNGPKVRTFSFPKDPARRAQWKKAIRRVDVDLDTLRDPQVCERHFKAEYLRTTTTYTDPTTGKTVEAKMGLTRLTPDAVPTIMLDCTKHLSDTTELRESPKAKRKRQENASIEEATRRSLETHAEEEMAHKVTTLKQIISQLNHMKLEPFWRILRTETSVMCIHVGDSEAPQIECSVVVSKDLSCRAYWRGSQLRSQGNLATIPESIEDMHTLRALLESMKAMKTTPHNEKEGTSAATVMLILSLLEDLVSEDLLSGEKHKALKFLQEQLKLLIQEKTSIRYTAELVIFASLMYTISPQAYKFIRSSGTVTLPHPSAILRVCRPLNVSSANEPNGEVFSSYVTRLVRSMRPHERKVALVVDKVHIQQYFEYKRGELTGTTSNSTEPAKTAHVYTMQSLLSAHKDVVHILPVSRIDAEQLHQSLKQLIIKLEEAGLTVVAVVSDNKAVNRKVMSFFSPKKKLDIVYPHPADPRRPLFFVVDPVHLLKCLRNNWLNQENAEKCMFYPPMNSASTASISGASFTTLRMLHEHERKGLVKFGHGLTYEALNPSNLERQSVKLALKVFNNNVAEAVRTHGKTLNLAYAEETADFITFIAKWWSVVNVKTPTKGSRLGDAFQEPITYLDCTQIGFLNMFVDWLDTWQNLGTDTGLLTQGLRLTSYALIELSRYCLEELNLEYVLLGKFQTDSLEERFGRYRQLPRSQYHVSITQLFESGRKIRLQDSLSFPSVGEAHCEITVPSEDELLQQYNVSITEHDIVLKEPDMPAIAYVAGFCAHAALRKLACEGCMENLTVQRRKFQAEKDILIENLSSGSLKFPQPCVLNAVLHMQIVLDKLTENGANRQKFLTVTAENQRGILLGLAKRHLSSAEDEGFDVCRNGHHPETVLTYILCAAAHTLLTNYVQHENDHLRTKKAVEKKQKLKA